MSVQGNEMEAAAGLGWAELKDDTSLQRESSRNHGDRMLFIARRQTSSTAC
jgi:hypothetical protein